MKKTMMAGDGLTNLDSMLEDIPEDGVSYIQSNPIELELSKDKREEVHGIVQEVLRFGVDQRQVLYLIYQLAMNLENRDAMVEITNAVNRTREQVPLSQPQATHKKILSSSGLPLSSSSTNKKKLIAG